MVWLYNSLGKSLLAVSLFHMMQNVTWQLFPVQGSFYDPAVTGVLMAAIAIGLAIIFRRPKAPARPKAASRSDPPPGA
jgi:hypothetical protein